MVCLFVCLFVCFCHQGFLPPGALSESETQVERQRQPSTPLPLGKLLCRCFQVVLEAGTQVLALVRVHSTR